MSGKTFMQDCTNLPIHQSLSGRASIEFVISFVAVVGIFITDSILSTEIKTISITSFISPHVYYNSLFYMINVVLPVVRGAMGCGQKNFQLVWRCHDLLSGFLAKRHLPPVSQSSQSQQGIDFTALSDISWFVLTDKPPLNYSYIILYYIIS